MFAPRTRVLTIRDGQSVAETLRELRARPEVATAAPNPIARVSAFVPPDPGNAGVAGGWQQLQWNFLPDAGVNAPDAWQRMIDVGRPGGAGVTVAVLDTGVAYSNRGRCPRSAESTSRRTVTCRRSPDFRDGDFVAGYDFVDGDTRPNDENGHGTHVSGTIGEGTGDNVGVTGLAYGARIMPVRVLDRLGEGDSVAISAGIRFAARKGADVINLSFEFGTQVTRARDPGHPLRAALRAPQGLARGRRVRQRGGPQHRLPGARLAGAVRRRDHPARAAWPSTPTTAPTSTSSPPAAARTRGSPATPTAGPTSGPAATSSR